MAIGTISVSPEDLEPGRIELAPETHAWKARARKLAEEHWNGYTRHILSLMDMPEDVDAQAELAEFLSMSHFRHGYKHCIQDILDGRIDLTPIRVSLSIDDEPISGNENQPVSTDKPNLPMPPAPAGSTGESIADDG